MAEKTEKNASEFANINRANSRLDPEVWPHINPSFSIPAGGTIYTIGSCFARNIEGNLFRLGFDVPTVGHRLPIEEDPGDTGNDFLNRYTPPSISQDILWAHGLMKAGDRYDPASCAPFMLEVDDGKVIDLGHAPFIPVTPARFHERREEFYGLYKKMFSAACVTLTLGLIEAWRHQPTGVYAHSTPSGRPMIRRREEFEFRRLDYNECLSHIQASIDAIKDLHPEVKILITTSPISLTKTFSKDDIIVANMYSKSILRAVAGKISEDNTGVDYFPSYESATMTKTWDIWEADYAHLKKSFVSKIVENLTGYYFSETDPVWVQLQKAHRLRFERKPEEAGKTALAAIQSVKDPDARMLGFAAELMKGLGDWPAYEAILRRALDLARTAPELSALAGRLVTSSPDEAKALIEEALELTPNNLRLRTLKARIQFAQKDEAGAAETLNQAITHSPDDANQLVAVSTIWLKAGHPEKAEPLLRKALSLVRPFVRNRVHGEIAKCIAARSTPEAAVAYIESIGIDLSKDKYLWHVHKAISQPKAATSGTSDSLTEPEALAVDDE